MKSRLIKIIITVCSIFILTQNIYSQSNTLDGQRKMEAYIDLYDLSDDAHSQSVYIRQALEQALLLKNQTYIFETLDILCRTYKNNPDSLHHYQQIGEKHLTGPYRNFCLAWLKAYPSVCKLDEAETPDEANQEIARYKEHKGDISDKAQEVQWEMILCSAMECLNYFSPAAVKPADRIIHLQNIRQMVAGVPFEISYKFNWYYLTRIEFIYRSEERAEEARKAVEALEQLDQLYNRQFELPFWKKRPNLRIRNRETSRWGVYSEMLYFGETIGRKKADAVYEWLKEYHRKNPSANSRQKFLSIVLPYYSYTEQYALAMQTVDELLAQTDTSNVNRRTELLAKKIELVTKWKQYYKEGFDAFWEYNALMERNRVDETNKQLAEMRSLFEVDKLKMKQTELQAYYQRIALLALLVLALIFLAWGLYQFWLKKRLKIAQQALIKANKKVEEESERAKESDRMKTEFLQSMSHEIRTPLNSICGFSSLLLDEGVPAEDKTEFPVIIEKNSRQLTELFESILHVADLNSSLDLFPMEDVDIQPVCRDILEEYKKKADALGLACTFESVLDKCLVKTNVLNLQYVVKHLLDNALKFTTSGGISVCVACVENKVRISIADTGTGIPGDKAEYIFDRFTKLDDFMPGTGLGLYSCRLIVTRLGGSIYLDTAYENGACFCIDLPAGR